MAETSAPIKRPRLLHSLIKLAAAEGRTLIFNYDHPTRGLELRELVPDRDEPIRLSKSAAGRYMIGHDPNRDGARNFTLNRIRDVTIR